MKINFNFSPPVINFQFQLIFPATLILVWQAVMHSFINLTAAVCIVCKQTVMNLKLTQEDK